eukprot:9467039-Pyramimonas_sp.AAC.1
MAGPVGACRQFWESVQYTKYMERHPDLAQDTWARTIPIGIHGDGGASSKQENLLTLSWNSLLGAGSTLSKRFLFTVILKSHMVADTLNTILRILAWSLNALLSGATPKQDAFGNNLIDAGVPLAGSWRGAACQIRGDWEFYCSTMGFPQWNSGDRMCWMCRASNTVEELLWTNFADDAPWRSTLFTRETHRDFLRPRGQAIPTLLNYVRGLRLENIMVDVPHAIDLGVAAHTLGNILFLFGAVRKSFGGTNMNAGVEKMSEHMHAWYSTHKVDSRLRGKLTLEVLRQQGGWPKLRGKAAPVRKLAKYALHVVELFQDGSEHDRLVYALIRCLCKFYDIIDANSQFLPEESKNEMSVLGRKFCQIYNALAVQAFNDHIRMWKLSPKMHVLIHLCETQSATRGNPRFVWTYADEDLVGCMIDVARTCHVRTVSFSVLFTWLHCHFAED